MKFPRASYFRWQLWVTLLCCLCTTAVAAPTSKKKSTKSSSAKKSQTVRKAKPAKPPRPPEPEFLPGGIPNTRAAAVIVIDARTGAVLYEKNADAPRAPASTVKLLTSLIVAERGYLDQMVTIMPSDTFAEPTKLNVKAGETYRRIDLMRALLVKSPNDVASALARDYAGSPEAFAAVMNQRARQAGATNSRFMNPNGLPNPAQFSTARDLAMIARAAYANPTIRQTVAMPQVVFRFNDGRTRQLENTNKVLKSLPYCNGMKTGYTNLAGSCLISSASRPGRDVITVILGHTKPRIWQDSAAFLTWALWHNPALAGTSASSAP
ncbi:MAG: D-alanyl-D-alanine carboxypeptidase [Chthoniobacterales bacterium]|nr:D-alanyl-D-alanine carboxypeptidase [Chthoniobacterales bacterium]